MGRTAPRGRQRAGLVGAGYIARHHLSAVRALGCEVTAVCDLDRRAAERLCAAHGTGRAYGDLDGMLAGERLDVVHVLTPPHVHVEPTRRCLEAGVDVLVEKPLAHTSAGCAELAVLAARRGRAVGASHNFLCFEAYERLVEDVRSGRLGRIDQVDVVWNKALGQLAGGPYGAWVLQHPSHVLFEVAPHSFAHAVHLLDEVTDLSVDARDEVSLPRGLRFYRRWEIRGWAGQTSLRIRFSFIEGFPEHYVHVRGSNGVGRVDFEANTYTRREHTPYLLDVDRFANVADEAGTSVAQAGRTLASVALAKAGLVKVDGPFSTSIARAVRRFYETRGGELDERLGPTLAARAVELAERVRDLADLPEPPGAPRIQASEAQADTLVIGGTGFIGRALVRKLVEDGARVRVLARDPAGCPPELRAQGVSVVAGDFTEPSSVARALHGIRDVVHLARGHGRTWDEYLRGDVEPARRLGELCVAVGVRRFSYASSIAIYYAGRRGATITEDTALVDDMLRANPYARAKAENERELLRLHRERGLPLVVFRPGIVLGRGGNPYHWGICEWPYHSVCRLYGAGDDPLPIVLVDDVADAMTRARHVEGIEGRSYNLAAAPSITANEYLDELERRVGIRIRRVPRPGWRAYLTAMAKYAIKTMGNDPSAVRPSYADWQGRCFASVFDASRARRELGWAPTEDRETLVREGIHAAVDAHFDARGASSASVSADAPAERRRAEPRDERGARAADAGMAG